MTSQETICAMCFHSATNEDAGTLEIASMELRQQRTGAVDRTRLVNGTHLQQLGWHFACGAQVDCPHPGDQRLQNKPAVAAAIATAATTTAPPCPPTTACTGLSSAAPITSAIASAPTAIAAAASAASSSTRSSTTLSAWLCAPVGRHILCRFRCNPREL